MTLIPDDRPRTWPRLLADLTAIAIVLGGIVALVFIIAGGAARAAQPLPPCPKTVGHTPPDNPAQCTGVVFPPQLAVDAANCLSSDVKVCQAQLRGCKDEIKLHSTKLNGELAACQKKSDTLSARVLECCSMEPTAVPLVEQPWFVATITGVVVGLIAGAGVALYYEALEK